MSANSPIPAPPPIALMLLKPPHTRMRCGYERYRGRVHYRMQSPHPDTLGLGLRLGTAEAVSHEMEQEPDQENRHDQQ